MPDEEIQETTLPGEEASRSWIMYFDGAFSLQGAGASVLLVAPIGEGLKYVSPDALSPGEINKQHRRV